MINATCHPERPNYARNLCKSCYYSPDTYLRKVSEGQASCAHPNVDIEIFYTEDAGRQSTRRAKLICNGCPVKKECLQAAMTYERRLRDSDDNPNRFGVWGGLDPKERRDLAAKNRRAA